MKQIIIHPGYRKSATTYLQNIIFKNLDANILAKPISDKKIRTTNYYKLFKLEYFKYSDYDHLLRENNLFKIKNFEKELLEKIKNKKKLTIISDEGLFGNSHFNGISNIYLISQLLKNLRKKYKFDIKVILSIRNQFDLIRSNYFYNEYFHKNFTLSSYYQYILHHTNKGEDLNYNFNTLINILEDTISKKIFILPIENLKSEPGKIIKKLCSFLNVNYEQRKFKNYKKNKNHINENNNLYYNKIIVGSNWIEIISKKFFYYIKRNKIIYKFMVMIKINYFLKKIINKFKVKKVIYDDKNNMYQKKIKNKYKKFNIELEKKFKLNLKDLNYY
jgi:hypothetical protein